MKIWSEKGISVPIHPGIICFKGGDKVMEGRGGDTDGQPLSDKPSLIPYGETCSTRQY